MRQMIQWIRTMLPSALLMLTAGWFAACSQNDDLADTPPTTPPAEQTERPITFGGDIDDEEQQARTRATSPFHQRSTRFVFSGYKHYDEDYSDPDQRQKVFPAYTMLYDDALANTATDNKSGWYYVHGSQTIKYWDYAATAYRFFAISGAYTAKGEDPNKRYLSIYADGADEDAGGTETPYLSHTLIVKREDFGKPVVLTFYKPLVRVRFMLMDGTGKVITKNNVLSGLIDKTSIRFRPTDSSRSVLYAATYNSTHHLLGTTAHELTLDPSPSLQSFHEALTIPYESQPTAPDDFAFVTEAQKERWWHVLEPAQPYGSFSMLLNFNGVLRSAVIPAEYMQWKIGYAYTYVFKVSNDEIYFDPRLFTYTKWQAGYSETTTW